MLYWMQYGAGEPTRYIGRTYPGEPAVAAIVFAKEVAGPSGETVEACTILYLGHGSDGIPGTSGIQRSTLPEGMDPHSDEAKRYVETLWRMSQ